MMGVRGCGVAKLSLTDVRIPKENLIGKEGDGFKIALGSLDHGRIGIAAQAVGTSQAALEGSIRYSKERQQFGKPISSFQAIQWMLVSRQSNGCSPMPERWWMRQGSLPTAPRT